MKQHLIQFLNRNNINLTNQTICIGVSTGVDSTVLLHTLLLLKEDYNLNIILCHVNHGKREQSNIEEKYIMDFSKKNNLILEILHLDNKEIANDNFQNAARIKRLAFFNEIMNKYNSNYLFLAHHLNDDIETSLMHIIRGSNLKGYSGMDEVVINKNNKYVVRPFLKVLKNEIIEYAKNNNIKYFEDDSNNSDCYTRNRIRHHLIPLLFEENNNFSKQFLEYKEVLINSYNIVCEQRDSIIKDIREESDSKIIVQLDKFIKLSDFMQNEVLFAILKKYQLSKVNINQIIKLMISNKPNITINYKNIVFSKQYNSVIFEDFEKKQTKVKEDINITIDKIGIYDINDDYYLEVKKFDNEDYKKCQNTLINLNVIWYNSSMLPVVLRNRKNGDRIGINKGMKKVKDLLIDEKIPLDKRDNLLLLEKDNVILNIFGVKKSNTILSMKQNNNILIVLREKNNVNA